MIKHNIRHEVRILSRNHWFIILTLVLTLMCLYAGHNGLRHFERKQKDQDQAIQRQEKEEDNVREIGLALQRGETHPQSYRLTPMTVAIRTGRLSALPSNDLSILSIGQSDLYRHQTEISSSDNTATIGFNELRNPIELLFGKFDVTFVITYLIPLLVIAFTYNLYSSELESGRLKLIASNPVRIRSLLLQRFSIRFFSLALILTVALAITILVTGVVYNSRLLLFFILTNAYLVFWFALSFLVNLFGKSSGKNVVSLLSIWILLVLIIPTAINQTANTLYPVPSRLLLLNEIRETKKELSKQQDKVLDEYLRNHPELISSKGDRSYEYWKGFFASQEIMEKELSPLTNEFHQKLNGQQKWVDNWGVLSPAILFQYGATQLAGTSSDNYNEFKKATQSFSVEWRSHLMPFIFSNKSLTLEDFENLPQFKYESQFSQAAISLNIGVLLLASALFVLIGQVMERKRSIINSK